MKNIIKSRLDKISDLEERKIYKKMVQNIYQEVVIYNMDMYEKLEKQLYTEIYDPLDKFYVYSTVLDISDVSSKSNFFHPVIKDDLNLNDFDTQEITKKLKNGFEVIISTLFLKCNYLIFNEIIISNRQYKALIKTNKDTYKVNVKLKQSMKYIKKIQNLYNIFKLNSIEWNTINCPYAYKFVDIILDSFINLKQGEKIEQITINLEEYDKYKQVNKIVCWNIKKIKVYDNTFPMPIEDRINYEHSISLSQFGIKNGYMISEDKNKFEDKKIYEDNFIIVSKIKKLCSWNLIKIENLSVIDNKDLNSNYEILSNKRNLGFIGRFWSIKSIVIRTRGEIARLISSYDLGEDLLFLDIELTDNYNKVLQTVNYNDFINDEIRINEYKKILILKFKAHNREDFLIFDKMSFLISEIQMKFPEYRCIGELL